MRSESSCVRTSRPSSLECASSLHLSSLLISTHSIPPSFASLSTRQIEAKQYRDALALVEGLLKEVKRLDDKLILTEVHLLESRANAETANWPKAKVCPPLGASRPILDSADH